MAARSALAGRMMAATRHAFNGRLVHTTTTTERQVSRGHLNDDDDNIDDMLDDIINCRVNPEDMPTVLVRTSRTVINSHTKNIKFHANPYSGPPDGDILYDRAWRNNLIMLFLLSLWFGKSHAQRNANQVDHSSAAPTS